MKIPFKRDGTASTITEPSYALITELFLGTVNSRYLDFGYLESPLISKRKFGPCFNTEIKSQVTKYCGKE